MPDDELFELADEGKLRNGRHPRGAGPADAPRSRRRRRWSRTSPASGCSCATSRPFEPDQRPFPDVRRAAARGDAEGDRAVLRGDHARGPQRPRLPRRRLHVRQRAAGASTTASPASTGDAVPPGRRSEGRAAGRGDDAGQRPDGDLEPDADLAGEARQVGPGADPRHAAAAAAARTCPS